MISSIESFSSEILFEIFEYLSPYELFQSFINLNYRINNIVHSYPLHLDFSLISRLEFDYICLNLQPKQIISLILSDEIIPQSVKYLEIRKYNAYKNVDSNFKPLIKQQAKFLTYLKIHRIDILKSINTQFPVLTHLIIDGGFAPDIDRCIESTNFNSIFQCLGSSITHLYLFIDNEKGLNINLQLFSHCLTHLTLHFYEELVVSFESIKQCVINLYQLKRLTLQASGKYDLIDGNQWKDLILKTNIIKFNFKFQILNYNLKVNEGISILLESFRSSFWIEQKHCYVGIHYDEDNQQTFLYTIPRFRFKDITYPSVNFSYKTTAPSNIEQYFFYQHKIDSLIIDIDKYITPSIHRFTQVKSLILSGSILMSLDILKIIIDLNQIEKLDVYSIESLSINELYKLIKYLPRLNELTMEFSSIICCTITNSYS
ncbi:unnamed protein product [Rotaria sordida]|uniref:F-box domain-containing protein n=1 Tax=Rotaria sordida TaxID=392033 RepID=A0A819UR62_9BILA|nr:unnamed protein product [Rotaria sordida]